MLVTTVGTLVTRALDRGVTQPTAVCHRTAVTFLLVSKVPNTCKWTQLGKEYQGTLSTTLYGNTCQRWDSQTPHYHSITNEADFPDKVNTLSEIENYCRNVDGEIEGPWCYTTSSVRWEYCDVPYCDTTITSCITTSTGEEYTGKMSVTNSHKTCERWDTISSQGFPVTDSQFRADKVTSVSSVVNYCRNLNGESGVPSCYTTDPTTEQEDCPIPQCHQSSGGYGIHIGYRCAANDIGGSPDTEDVEVCQAFCDASSQCVAFEFDFANSVHKCYAKSVCDLAAAGRNTISIFIKYDIGGWSLSQHKDCVGPDNDLTSLQTYTPAACAQQCDNHADCTAFLFNTQSLFCWLKSTCDQLVTNSPFLAYRKMDYPAVELRTFSEKWCDGSSEIAEFTGLAAQHNCVSICGARTYCQVAVYDTLTHTCYLLVNCTSVSYSPHHNVYIKQDQWSEWSEWTQCSSTTWQKTRNKDCVMGNCQSSSLISATHCIPDQSHVTLLVIEDVRLTNNTLVSFHIKSMLACMVECRIRHDCGSINFRADNEVNGGFCELNTLLPSNDKQYYLEQAEGFQHFPLEKN